MSPPSPSPPETREENKTTKLTIEATSDFHDIDITTTLSSEELCRLFPSIEDETPVEIWVIESHGSGPVGAKGNKTLALTYIWKDFPNKNIVVSKAGFDKNNPVIIEMVYINFELVMVGAISKSGFVTSTNKISERSQADRLLWLKECVAEYESHIVLLNKIVA